MVCQGSCLDWTVTWRGQFGVAQLTGINAAAISTLVSSLIAIETFIGKKTSCNPNSWWGQLLLNRILQAQEEEMLRQQKNKAVLYMQKACAKADVSRNSIYGFVSAFHDEMLTSTKTSLLEKGWATEITPLSEPMSCSYRNCAISWISELASELFGCLCLASSSYSPHCLCHLGETASRRRARVLIWSYSQTFNR